MKKTIDRLSHPDSTFFIHIDGKSDIRQFSGLAAPNVVFLKQRIPVFWAEFSGNHAILLLIQEALAKENYDYLILMSGSEYPLRSGGYVHEFLAANKGKEFINIVKMPNAEAGKPIKRITTIRYPVKQPVLRFVFRALAKAGLADRDYRKHLGGLAPYGGNTWWALSREACEYILQFHSQNPQLEKYFWKVFAPEEYFVHTILGNSKFRPQMRRSLVFEDWSAGGGHPAMITEHHLAFFESCNEVMVKDVHGPGEMLFARKLSDDSLSLLPRIDRMIEQKERVAINV